LRQQAKGEDIHFAVQASHAVLEDYYTRASIFRHATGFGRLPDDPEQAEHFGMTTLEAMSYGVVPLPYGDRGQLEFVDDSVGSPWRNQTELTARTLARIDSPRSGIAWRGPPVKSRCCIHARPSPGASPGRSLRSQGLPGASPDCSLPTQARLLASNSG
jgi:hypothetical protein